MHTLTTGPPHAYAGHMNLCNTANGNSFGDGSEGSERTSPAAEWMFPGGNSGIQQQGNRLR